MIEIKVKSSLDGSMEPSLFFQAKGKHRPLVVGLHTWSADRFNQVDRLPPFCVKRDWNIVLPEFRGPNLVSNPRRHEALGSELAMTDIFDVTEWIKGHYDVDTENVFVMGGSGGGHMTLMLAGARPNFFTAYSAWCPITDVAAWHGQNPGYTPHMTTCCGGTPDQVPEEYKKRSPLTYFENIRKCRELSLNHGRFDPSVPCRQSIELINMIGAGAPGFFFRIFDGGHEFFEDQAFFWFDRIIAGKDGKKITG